MIKNILLVSIVFLFSLGISVYAQSVFDFDQGGTGQSFYTTGDLLVGDSASGVAKFTVGANDTLLTASSAATLGVDWITCAQLTGSADLCDGNDASGSAEWTDTGTILHPADSSGTVDELVIGGTTEAGADIFLGVDGAAAFNEQSGSTGDFKIESDGNDPMFFVDYSANCIAINQSSCTDDFEVTGEIDLTHTAVANDEHAIEMIVDAAGFGDIKALDIDYITGSIGAGESESIILVNIDENAATAGDIHGLTVLTTTTGSANVRALEAGVGVAPIEHHSGTFGNPLRCEQFDDSGSSFTDCLDAFTNTATDVSVWAEDNDIVYLAFSATENFEEIEWIFATAATNPGIQPTFEFPNATVWTTFSPTDGTNGARNTGIMDWDADGLINWTATTVDSDSAKWIRITRTANNITAPTEDFVQVSDPTDFFWDVSANVEINTISLESAGVKLSGDDDGAITFLGLGNGSDEDFTINLDDTANTAVFTSSTGLNKFDFAAIGIELDQDINITLGDETLDHNGTDFVFSDSISVSGILISGDRINDFNGRSLSVTSNVLDADAELYTDTKSFVVEKIVDGDDQLVQLKFSSAVTILRISCSTDTGTSTITFDERDEGAPNTASTTIPSNDIVCDTDTQSTTSFNNASILADNIMNMTASSIAGSPVSTRIHIDYSYDD